MNFIVNYFFLLYALGFIVNHSSVHATSKNRYFGNISSKYLAKCLFTHALLNRSEVT